MSFRYVVHGPSSQSGEGADLMLDMQIWSSAVLASVGDRAQSAQLCNIRHRALQLATLRDPRPAFARRPGLCSSRCCPTDRRELTGTPSRYGRNVQRSSNSDPSIGECDHASKRPFTWGR